MNSSDKATMIAVVAGLILFAIVLLAIPITLVALDSMTRDELPRCHEAQLLEGLGGFRDGQWDDYTCKDAP